MLKLGVIFIGIFLKFFPWTCITGIILLKVFLEKKLCNSVQWVPNEVRIERALYVGEWTHMGLGSQYTQQNGPWARSWGVGSTITMMVSSTYMLLLQQQTVSSVRIFFLCWKRPSFVQLSWFLSSGQGLVQGWTCGPVLAREMGKGTFFF